MYRRFKDRFGAAGILIAVIALVAALSGTALAAKSALTGKQKKEVEKIAKKYAGKPGEQGPKGDPGAAGKNGANGTNGKDGEGVTVAAASGAECPLGGTKFTNASGSGKACNGAEGPEGPEGPEGDEGSPWTLGGTLPPGATETGYWAVSGTEADTAGLVAPISFPIPFSFNIKTANTHFGLAGSGGAFSAAGACPGPDSFTPKAAPGHLCVYQADLGGLTNTTFKAILRNPELSAGASSAGAFVAFTTPTGVAFAGGSYAVTGCVQVPNVNECQP